VNDVALIVTLGEGFPVICPVDVSNFNPVGNVGLIE
jgi:hypothetical protein